MQTAEQVFMGQLETVLQEPFNAKIFPSPEDGIEKARVNTDQEISGSQFLSMIELAESYKLNLKVARSGAGLKVLFHKNKK